MVPKIPGKSTTDQTPHETTTTDHPTQNTTTPHRTGDTSPELQVMLNLSTQILYTRARISETRALQIHIQQRLNYLESQLKKYQAQMDELQLGQQVLSLNGEPL